MWHGCCHSTILRTTQEERYSEKVAFGAEDTRDTIGWAEDTSCHEGMKSGKEYPTFRKTDE